MESKQSSYILLIKRLSLVALIYTLCRLIFFLTNLSYFHSLSFSEIALSFFYGIRFDITAIVISNTPIILLHLLPRKIFHTRIVSIVNKSLFVVINSFMFFLSAIDFGLFRFTSKHSTADVFKIISFGNDFKNTVPKMISDFWYLLLILIFLVILLIKIYPKKANQLDLFDRPFFRSIFGKIITGIAFIGLFFIGFRGGIQFKPLTIISASRYGNSNMAPLILNTPFTYLKTYGKSELKELHFMPETQAAQLAPFIHKGSKEPFRKKNVVLIILESFGKEYSGLLNDTLGYTPFLDSLMKQSLYCTNAYANGKRSIEGIPAITAGLPALMTEPIITSSYGVNAMTSLANTLGKKGYQTYFFHGGTNGTMGFDNFSKAIGYQHYFGRTEYNNDNDFDGNWGIYDEPFLKRMADEMSTVDAPFFTTLFTLSSHHPYSIPAQYSGKFKPGSLPIHISIRYADYALKKFFEYAEMQKWYSNTLFVITADHTALTEKQFYMNRQGMYAIPLLFFSPSDSLIRKEIKTTQQIDILPSVLSYLNYDEDYFAYGQSVFDSSRTGYAINYLNDSYQWIEDNHAFILNDGTQNEFYQFEDVSQNALLTRSDSATIHLKLNAFLQQFTSSLIHNKMTVH